MSFDVAILEAMKAEGLDLDACIRILRSSAHPDSAAEKRRAYDRERKAEKRAEAKSGGMSGGNPPDPAPNERENLTPTREGKTEPKGSSKSLIEIEKRRALASCLQIAFTLPDDIPMGPWDAWVDMRRRLRKNPTDHAKGLAVTELRRLRDEEGWPPGDVLNHCTMNSYQGIFPPRRGQNERSDPNPTATAAARVTAAIRRSGANG